MGAEGSDKTHVKPGTEMFLGENRGDPIKFSHAVIDAGADLIVGHGPHVLRGDGVLQGPADRVQPGQLRRRRQDAVAATAGSAAAASCKVSLTSGRHAGPAASSLSTYMNAAGMPTRDDRTNAGRSWSRELSARRLRRDAARRSTRTDRSRRRPRRTCRGCDVLCGGDSYALRPPWQSARRRSTAETDLGRKRRARKMARELAETHPDAHCELDFTNPLQLAVATILSAQSTDKRVNEVTPEALRALPDRRRLRRRPTGPSWRSCSGRPASSGTRPTR